MNIIFGRDQADQLRDRYTVLELDTFRVEPDQKVITAYCVIELVPLTEMNLIDSLRDLHHNLLLNYRKQDWNYCEQALEHLSGKWQGVMDSFYGNLYTRIQNFKQTPPDADWDGIVVKQGSDPVLV